MSFISRLKKNDICEFVNLVLSSENAYINNIKYQYIDFERYYTFIKENNAITVMTNFNCGLCCYNEFTLTDNKFSSLYPTCKSNGAYNEAWQKFLANKFPDYIIDSGRNN